MTLLGAPIFVIIGGIALLGFVVSNNYEIDSSIAIIQEMYKIAEQPVFITIPLFTFAGYLMAESKTSERLINLSKAFFGWMPGGLGIVALIACSFFTVFTGASGVTIIALGGLLFPSLIKEKYPEKFSLGILTIGGSRGITFPPSLPLILYGVIASMSMQNLDNAKPVSIDNLFIAGAIPGIIEIVVLAIYSVYIASKFEVERTKFSINECIASLKNSFWELPIPLIILIGIYGGIFTASEAASVVAFYVFIVEVFIYKDISIKTDLVRIIKESMLLVGGIFIIIGVALGLTNFMIDQELPIFLLEWVKKYINDKITFLIILNIFLLVVGALLDIFSAILVVVPLIIPIALEYGVDPTHLGIIFLLNLEIGYSTPPVGLNLFISSFRFNKSILTLYSSTLPFLGLMFLTLMLVTYVPDISLAFLEENKIKGYMILFFTFLIFIISMLIFYKKTPKLLENKEDNG
jgi:tripartite ATP-independent transporter DctM subunit